MLIKLVLKEPFKSKFTYAGLNVCNQVVSLWNREYQTPMVMTLDMYNRSVDAGKILCLAEYDAILYNEQRKQYQPDLSSKVVEHNVVREMPNPDVLRNDIRMIKHIKLETVIKTDYPADKPDFYIAKKQSKLHQNDDLNDLLKQATAVAKSLPDCKKPTLEKKSLFSTLKSLFVRNPIVPINMTKIHPGIYVVRTQAGFKQALADHYAEDMKKESLPIKFPPTSYPSLVMLYDGYCGYNFIGCRSVHLNKLNEIVEQDKKIQHLLLNGRCQ